MRAHASPRAPHRVAALLCVASLAACYGDDPVQVDGPSFAKPVSPSCTGDTTLEGTSPLTIQARDQFGDPVLGFTASVFNSCGRIRVAQDGVGDGSPDGALTFQFAAGASVFVVAQGGVTAAAASLEFVPPPALAGLAFGGAPLNAARMTVAGQGNTILSEIPTLARLQTAVSNPAVTVKNTGTTVLMTLPKPTDTDGNDDGLLERARQIRPFNLADEAALPIVAVQVLESPPTLTGCGLFTSTNLDLCLSGEGVGLIRGLDLMNPVDEDFTTIATAELDGVPCVIEVLGNPGGGQGLLTASVPCDTSTGIDQNGDKIEEIFVFARPAFCDLDVTVDQSDTIGDANVLDFLRLEAGVVTHPDFYPGTQPSATAIAVIGEALLLSVEPVTMTLTVKETGTATGSSVHNINVQLTPDGIDGTSFVLVDCTSDTQGSPAFCVSDPRGLAGHSGTLVLWNILVNGLAEGSTREVSVNVKGKDAVPDADKSGGEARLTVPDVNVPMDDVCPVENGGGRFSPIGG